MVQFSGCRRKPPAWQAPNQRDRPLPHLPSPRGKILERCGQTLPQAPAWQRFRVVSPMQLVNIIKGDLVGTNYSKTQAAVGRMHANYCKIHANYCELHANYSRITANYTRQLHANYCEIHVNFSNYTHATIVTHHTHTPLPNYFVCTRSAYFLMFMFLKKASPDLFGNPFYANRKNGSLSRLMKLNMLFL